MNNELKDLLEIKERLVKIEVLLSEKVNQLEQRITNMENNQKWFIRIILSAVLVSILSLLSLQY